MMEWDAKRWPNFERSEIACRCCGELALDDFAVRSMDMLQDLRTRLGEPMRIISGHRCKEHNAIVGGDAHSLHLKLAFDIDVMGRDRRKIYELARDAGFTGFGFMEKGLHADAGPARHWDYGPKSRLAWKGIMPDGGGTFVVHPKTGEGIA